MFRILQQFILITILAVFSSQASAMFIQADWYEPNDPAVGTNRYAYSQNNPINLADPGGNVPYNPGGDTSTGWTDSSSPGENGNGRETYDSRTDRYSRDYLNQDGDGHHTIGEYNYERFSEDEYGSRTRKRSGVHSGFYDKNPGYRQAEQDAVNLDGSRNMGYARQAAGVVAGAAALATGAGEIAAATRIGSGILSSGRVVSGYRAVSPEEAADIAANGFRSGPNSLEGKWFTETLQQAREFLNDPRFGATDIVRGRIPRDVYDRSYKHPNLDNRGPSFYVSPEDLPNIK